MKRAAIILTAILGFSLFIGLRMTPKDTALLEGAFGNVLGIVSGVAIAAAFFLAQTLEDVAYTTIEKLNTMRARRGETRLNAAVEDQIYSAADDARIRTHRNAAAIVVCCMIYLVLIVLANIDLPLVSASAEHRTLGLQLVHAGGISCCLVAFSCTFDILKTGLIVQNIRSIPRQG